ncbi:methyltransferase domain-containing protein [Streptomyces sp. DSM 41982]|uniref:Methyltransferase domain-containing protein n=1 Tax=Streptomyces evansiae TaxID=3075535 RepID=A0ABD5EHA8_9ACTN|nr:MULTISPECIES: class I SAM-dependent methyltransferase [unclassified Streptomyces]MDT0419580.1 methyltransferase domain-containing protein [Streptomyces sp. DSM 41982]SCE25184.1 Methyltransferase domain-containing protein [Streptomyces sp. SolWspMP-sol7th]
MPTTTITTDETASTDGALGHSLLRGDELLRAESPDPQYDRPRELSRYLLMHYGSFEDTFERPDHPLAGAYGYAHRLSEALRAAAELTGCRVRDALDVGCNVGGVSHELARWVEDSVVGVDLSPRAVEVARRVTDAGGGSFSVVKGAGTRTVRFRLPDRRERAELRFETGDGEALAGRPGGYDAVLVSNILDRVADPAACLAQFHDSERVLRAGGLLVIACPWSWYPEYTDPAAWFGADRPDHSSEHALKAALRDRFTLVAESEQAGVLCQNPREYDYFESHVTIWQHR